MCKTCENVIVSRILFICKNGDDVQEHWHVLHQKMRFSSYVKFINAEQTPNMQKKSCILGLYSQRMLMWMCKIWTMFKSRAKG